jgi:hypothetical protein
MAIKNEKILIRGGTQNNFSTTNNILGEFELGIEISNNSNTIERRIKCGDGHTRWNDLPYIVDEVEIKNIIDNLENDINAAIQNETTNRDNADIAINESITQEITRATTKETEIENNLSSANDALTEDIASEATSRTEADTILQENIDSLNTALNTEAETRENNDNNLQQQIYGTNSDLYSGIINLKNELTEIITENVSGLNYALDTEIEDRTTAISGVQSNIDSLSDALDSEIEDRTTAISGVQANIDTEISDRETAISGVASLLDTEISDRENAISGVQSLLDTEIENRETAITEVQANIDTEISDRESAISDLDSSKISIENLPSAVSSVGITSTNSSVSINKTITDTETGSETSSSMQIPIATKTKVGLMSNADLQQLETLTADVASLKGIQKYFAVELESESPTQEELAAAFGTASGLETPADGTTLIDLTHNKEYTYFESDGIWHSRGSASVAPATNDSPGIVQGSELDGKVYVETDSTMSLVGYDSLVNDIEDLKTNKLNNSDIVDNLSSTSSTKPLSAKQGKSLKDSLDSHTGNISNPHGVSKSQVGLGNVDNTSDANKPISTATQTALNGKQATINGTGFVKANGTTISYDNSTYATTSALSSTTTTANNAMPKSGGTFTGAIAIPAKTAAVANTSTAPCSEAQAYLIKTTADNAAIRRNYSTTAQNIGTWVDGKTLYRRVFSGNITSVANIISAITLLSSGVSNIINAYGYWRTSSDSNTIIVGQSIEGTFSLVLKGTDSSVSFFSQSPSARSSCPYYVVLEYTT